MIVFSLGLQEIANHIRGNPTLCPNGRQLTSADSFCRDANNCSRNFDLKNCSSGKHFSYVVGSFCIIT